jgi:pyruvate/2-oxoglutarate dehydrogenase complex dihydrolipoamide dehydrogenase (E3) component
VPGIRNYQWDEIFDVVGSGGGALTAALLAARSGASTVVAEKSEFIGGTTAVTGLVDKLQAQELVKRMPHHSW